MLPNIILNESIKTKKIFDFSTWAWMDLGRGTVAHLQYWKMDIVRRVPVTSPLPSVSHCTILGEKRLDSKKQYDLCVFNVWNAVLEHGQKLSIFCQIGWTQIDSNWKLDGETNNPCRNHSCILSGHRIELIYKSTQVCFTLGICLWSLKSVQ